jgi:carboxylesterase type B
MILGDPKRITIGGESAGGFSVDTYSYIWIDDPIINGIIAESGTSLTAMNLAQKPNTAEKHWFKFTNLLGCGGAEAGLSTIDCMRKIPATKIMETIQIATGNVLVGPFQPVIDNKTLFSDTRARADAGKFLKKV